LVPDEQAVLGRISNEKTVVTQEYASWSQ
jgi:hypothetical protein